MVRYNISAVLKGINNFGNYFSDTVYTAKLAAATAASIIVPNTGAIGYPGTTNGINKFVAVFSYDNAATDVWVALNQTAAVPAGSTFALSTSVLRPQARVVQGGDVLSFISAGTPNISVEFYAIQE